MKEGGRGEKNNNRERGEARPRAASSRRCSFSSFSLSLACAAPRSARACRVLEQMRGSFLCTLSREKMVPGCEQRGIILVLLFPPFFSSSPAPLSLFRVRDDTQARAVGSATAPKCTVPPAHGRQGAAVAASAKDGLSCSEASSWRRISLSCAAGRLAHAPPGRLFVLARLPASPGQSLPSPPHAVLPPSPLPFRSSDGV